MKQQHGWAFPEADVFMVNQMAPDGSYQADHLQRALMYVTDWRLAVDGGAHVGTWTRTLAGVFAAVIAVEPSPDTYEALCANMRAFGCTNVDTRPVALGAAAGQVSMALDAANTARANTGGRHVEAGGPIRCDALDDWTLTTLGFLKLDVEGSEPFAIAGAQQTIRRCRPIILFEDKALWRRYQLPREAPQQRLRALGYHRLDRVGCDEIWGPA